MKDETGFSEDTLRGETDEQTVANWLNIIRNWTDYRNIDQVPPEYRSPLIKEWFRSGWKDQVEKQIRKLQKGLPSG